MGVVDERGGVTIQGRRQRDRNKRRVPRPASRVLVLKVLDAHDAAGAVQPVVMQVRRQGGLRVRADGPHGEADAGAQVRQGQVTEAPSHGGRRSASRQGLCINPVEGGIQSVGLFSAMPAADTPVAEVLDTVEDLLGL